MKNVYGLEIKQMDFKPIKLGDFIYHEGPLLSHFIDESNSNNQYFYKWTDCNEELNRWLVVKFPKVVLLNFLSKEISFREIINNSTFVYLVDLDDNLIEKNIKIVRVEDLPEEYLPSINSFFKEEQYEQYALDLRDKFIISETLPKLSTFFEEIQTIKKEQKKNTKLLKLLLTNISQQNKREKVLY